MRNLTIVILGVLTITFGIYGYMQSLEAQRQSELAMQGERRALVAEDEALRYRDRAARCEHLATATAKDLAECQSKQSSK